MSPTSDLLPASSRCIFNDVDLEAWKTSPLKRDLLRVVGAMGKSCANSQSRYEYDAQHPLQGLSPAMASLHGSLTQMLRWLEDDIPPLGSSKDKSAGAAPAIRFGNPAFRDWNIRLKERSFAIFKEMYLVHQDSVGPGGMSVKEASQRGHQAAAGVASPSLTTDTEGPPFLLELASYLHDGFGHPVRLDYGTGHECSFMVVLYACCKLGWMDESVPDATSQPPGMDKLKAATVSIFHAYLLVTRQLQLQYRLEPAGSHGVWGLDDYHCLPFYFGACQCQSQSSGDEMPEPKEITEEVTRRRYSQSLLYFGCMDYICTLKRGAPLFECSPMLYDISQTCPAWTKVASGLLKLFEGEVLNKRQVVQHFTFGNKLFVATWEPSQTSPREAPTTNFRTMAGGAAVAPMVRAPWASDNANSNAGTMGRAPWATSNAASSGTGSAAVGAAAGGVNATSNSAMPPTKAPWTK